MNTTLLGIMLIVGDCFVFALATLLLKKYLNTAKQKVAHVNSLFKKLVTFVFTWKFIGINILLVSSMALLIGAYQFGDLSLLLPLGSLTQVFSLFFGYIFLREKINSTKIAGLVFIVIGSILISVT